MKYDSGVIYFWVHREKIYETRKYFKYLPVIWVTNNFSERYLCKINNRKTKLCNVYVFFLYRFVKHDRNENIILRKSFRLKRRELFHFREYFQPNDPEISHKKFVSISGERYFELCIRPFGNIEGFVFSSIEKLHNLLRNGLDRFDSVISVLRFIFRKRTHVLGNITQRKI